MKKFLNLIPFAQKKQLDRERMFLLMHGIIGIFVVIIAFSAIMLTIARFILINHFKKLKEDSSLVNIELLRLENNIGKINNKITNAEKIQTNFTKYSNLLFDFTKLIPKDIVLELVHFDTKNNIFQISGIAKNREALISFKKSLENSSNILKLESPLSNFLEKTNLKFKFSGKLAKGIYHD